MKSLSGCFYKPAKLYYRYELASIGGLHTIKKPSIFVLANYTLKAEIMFKITLVSEVVWMLKTKLTLCYFIFLRFGA